MYLLFVCLALVTVFEFSDCREVALQSCTLPLDPEDTCTEIILL